MSGSPMGQLGDEEARVSDLRPLTASKFLQAEKP